jgi:transposase-like protein
MGYSTTFKAFRRARVVHAIRRRLRGDEPLDVWGRRAFEEATVGGQVRAMIYLTHPGEVVDSPLMDEPKNLPRSLIEAIRYFNDQDVCVQFVAKLRWPDGPVCPTCGGTEHSYLTTRRVWKCKSCKRQFSVKVGSIFEDSAIPLDKWLAAMWMIANSKNGVSSHEMAQSLGITQKSAWFLLHRVRLAMQTGTFEKLDGEIEVEAAFIGG